MLVDFEHMKWRGRIVLGAALLLIIGGLLAVAWLNARPASQGPQQAKFIGLTNGVVGPIYSTLPTNYVPFMQQWRDTGTNAAIFSITNQQSYPILLYPYVSLQTKKTNQTNYETILLNAPTLYGIHLRPGQVAAVRVAVLPPQNSSRVKFYYIRDYYHFVPRLHEELRALVARTNVDFHNEPFYSDWFDK
jgi:hypothetical protein